MRSPSRRAVQCLGFAAVRTVGRPTRAGLVRVDEADGGHLTTVVRLPAPVAAGIEEVAAALPDRHALRRLGHDDLHLTIANLDPVVTDRAAVLDRVTRALAAAEAFRVRLEGLAMTRHSLYVQAWDEDGGLARLRDAVCAAAGVRLPIARRVLGFVTVARFTGADVDVDLLRRHVRRLHHEPFGGFTADAVEVVVTDTMLSPAATRVLARVDLGSR